MITRTQAKMKAQTAFTLIKFSVIMLAIWILVSTLAMTILSILGGFNNLKSTCWFRYAKNERDQTSSEAFTIQRSVELPASMNENVSVKLNPDGSTSIEADQASYGRWINGGEVSGPVVKIKLTGRLSLCRSYLPDYDLQTGAKRTKKIPIPRMNDPIPLTLIFPANSATWRNVAEIYPRDQIVVSVSPAFDQSNTLDVKKVAKYNMLSQLESGADPSRVLPQKTGQTADCSPSNRIVDSTCGRFSPFLTTVDTSRAGNNLIRPYISECIQYNTFSCEETTGCCVGSGIFKNCQGYTRCQWRTDENPDGTVTCTKIRSGGGGCSCNDPDITAVVKYKPVYLSAPLNFRSQEMIVKCTNSSASSAVDEVCKTSSQPSFQTLINNNRALFEGSCNNKEFRDALPGLLYKARTWLEDGSGIYFKQVPSNGSIPSIITGSLSEGTPIIVADLPKLGSRQIIYNPALDSMNSPVMVQFAYQNDGRGPGGNTGGYIINIQHDKCVRRNGEYFDDSFPERGKVLVKFLPQGANLNINKPDEPVMIKNAKAEATEYVIDSSEGSIHSFELDDTYLTKYGKQNIWFKIVNKPEDYQDSAGSYTVELLESERVGYFSEKILKPLFAAVDGMISGYGTDMFKRLTCYDLKTKSLSFLENLYTFRNHNNSAIQNPCLPFFKYVKALLTLYVMLFGFMFLLGKIKLNQKEFFVHIIKILIVGGLMNGSTFDYMNQNIIPFINNFTVEVMSNFGGYANDGVGFGYLDDAMSKLLLNKITLFQLLALPALGLNGMSAFAIAFTAIAEVFKGVFQGIATYMIAKIMLNFLIGMAPFFLVFMLFSSTQTLFSTWCNNILKFMLEPIVVLLGLAIFARLMAVYLDGLFAFSVCYKCAVPFKIPSLMKLIIPFAMSDIYLFCFYWFAPWGLNYQSGGAGISMVSLVGLFLVARMNSLYIYAASSIVSEITGSIGLSAAAAGAAAGNTINTAVKTAAKRGLIVAAKITKSTLKGMHKVAMLSGPYRNLFEGEIEKNKIIKASINKTIDAAFDGYERAKADKAKRDGDFVEHPKAKELKDPKDDQAKDNASATDSSAEKPEVAMDDSVDTESASPPAESKQDDQKGKTQEPPKQKASDTAAKSSAPNNKSKTPPPDPKDALDELDELLKKKPKT